MSYSNPKPKLPKVKASVMIPPGTLATIDQACHVTGRSRNAWLWGLVVEALPQLCDEADTLLRKIRRRR